MYICVTDWAADRNNVHQRVPFEIHTYESIMATLQVLLYEEKKRLRTAVTAAMSLFKHKALLKVEAQVTFLDIYACFATHTHKIKLICMFTRRKTCVP
jgi:hypothetical protein